LPAIRNEPAWLGRLREKIGSLLQESYDPALSQDKYQPAQEVIEYFENSSINIKNKSIFLHQ